MSRDTICDLLKSWIGRICQCGIHLRIHITRRQGVDIDALASPLVAQSFRQLGNTTLGSCISRYGKSTKEG